MPTPSITLTPEQWDKVQKDASGTHMLSEEEVGRLAALLNDKVNIPFMSENTEGKILIKLVRRVDSYLYDALPNELYEQIRDSADGISKEEAEEMKKILASRVNDKVNIKYLPESVEQKIFELLFGVLINAMRKNWNLDKAVNDE